MGLVGLRSESPFPIGLVLLVVALEPDDSAVALEGQHVCGDPNLGPEKDYAYGMRIVRTALEAMCTPVTEPTLFDPMDQAVELEVTHAS